MHRPSFLQRLFLCVFFPFAESMEKHSRSWRLTCPCGHATSVWEQGGIRWHAAGEGGQRVRCKACGLRTRHRLHWVEWTGRPAEGPDERRRGTRGPASRTSDGP